MAVVADEIFDVYVSYAGLDDSPKNDGRSWVGTFVANLEAEIARRLANRPKIFFDQKSVQVGAALDLYEQSAARAATMLILTSPAYLRSEWTRRELKAFRDSNRENQTLFVAELLPLPQGESYPADIASIFRVQLWETRRNGVVMPMALKSKRYGDTVARLAQGIADRLSALNRSRDSRPTGELTTSDRTKDTTGAPGARPDSNGASPERLDRYRTQTDDPARVDALERKPFAAILAKRIIEVRSAQKARGPSEERAFMVHLHGPWGSGKSSMLNLLEEKLQDPGLGTPSLVVWFNAWKHQRMRPPWWPLLTAIYNAATSRSPAAEDAARKRERHALQHLWWKWRLRADLLPGVLVALLLGGIAFSLLWGRESGPVETILKILVSIIAAGAALTTYAKLLAFGSDKAAKTYSDLTADPFSPVIKLFDSLVKTISPPLVVFIEDLDRCDSAYVVELLEGIQTLFREAEVTYVVAAERKWICTSFDKKYGDFSGSIGEPCRPLGYLFVDKIFQISAGMPRLTPELQSRYLSALLAKGEPEMSDPANDLVTAAKARVAGLTDESDLQQAIAEKAGGSIAEQRAIRAEAALQITSAEALSNTEHRLQKFATLLEPNPRSMKRLVNEVGMAQALGILEGRDVSAETRARWAMLSIRWPIFADFVSDNPEAIEYWSGSSHGDVADGQWPKEISELVGNKALTAVVGKRDDDGALTADSLKLLLS